MGWELLLVCNIFYFRIFRCEAIILTISPSTTVAWFFWHLIFTLKKFPQTKPFDGHYLSSDDVVDDHHCGFCIDISEYKWVMLMPPLRRCFCPYLTFCQIPRHLPWLPRNLFFISSTALLFGEHFCHVQTAVLMMIVPPSVSFYSCLSFP